MEGADKIWTVHISYQWFSQTCRCMFLYSRAVAERIADRHETNVVGSVSSPSTTGVRPRKMATNINPVIMRHY